MRASRGIRPPINENSSAITGNMSSGAMMPTSAPRPSLPAGGACGRRACAPLRLARSGASRVLNIRGCPIHFARSGRLSFR